MRMHLVQQQPALHHILTALRCLRRGQTPAACYFCGYSYQLCYIG